MASVFDVIAEFEKFDLNLIEKNWSDEIWSSDFTFCPEDLPEEFADKFSPLSYADIDHVIEETDKTINLWLTKSVDKSSNQCDSDESNSSTNNGGSSPSWMLLQDVKYKELLALLYYYVSKGQLNNQDNNAVNTCIKSTNFYFTLLIIPGSDVFKIFHITLFEKCLETLSLHKYLEIATGRKIKKIKSQKKNEDMSSDDEVLEMDETLTLSQQLMVVKQLNLLMLTFQQFVKKFSFKKYPEALTMSLSILADLTRLERNSSVHEFSSTNTLTSFVPLSRNAFMTMKNLCSSFHGRASEIVRLVLFYLVPNLTSVGGLVNPEINKFTPRELTNIRNIAVSFIIENIIPLGEDAQMGLKILIQQLCYNMIDRADYRCKATDMVITILCKLPKELYYNLMKWIFRMSMMEGAHHRVISLELLSKLIFMKPGTNEISKLVDLQHQLLDSQFQISNATGNAITNTDLFQKTENTTSLSQEPIISFSQPVNYVPLEFRRIMFAIIIDRIRDEAAIVRTRALSILADIISNKTSLALQLILRDLFIQPYVEMTSIYLKNFEKENEFVKWKTFIGFLEKASDSEISKQMFPGARVIVVKVFEKCLDERVNVRKAALQVISSLFKFCSKWMTSEALKLFGTHCRDPAVSIRKDMINSVTELLLFFPDHENIIELWVDEVVPLIMDREIKVQEHALQIFTNVILSKLKAFKDIDSNLDELPWKLIDKIAKQGKRSFFKAACALWTESGNFNQNLIEILKSHINTINDEPAWMFLACISEYFDILNSEFVMEYYQKIISKENGDKNKFYFALLTLSKSWHNLPKKKMEELQIEMYNKLKKFDVSPIFVTLTVEIVAGITVFIAEEKLSGKKEVAKWGIEMIQDCESHLENCLKLPLVKDSNCFQCINILGLLGALVGICPFKIENSTFSLLFNFLVDSCNKEGTVLQRKKCAIAVLTVSKMALYNDYFARNLVAGLAQLLSQSSDPIVLNNVMIAIADIGESYASLIEPIIPFLCVWLKSKHESLKEITLVLLIELLQEDYLKARDILVFHLLTLVNETNPWLVNIVKYYFMNSLLARNPYKMYQLLLPGLFHFNNYTSHPDYPRLDMTEAEWQAFDLSGSENHLKRLSIYKFMLSNIPYMVKMKCLHFICTVVLNGVADEIINIKKKNGEQLLFDALCILVLPEIKIEYKDLVRGKNEDGEDDEEQKQMPLCKLVKQMFTAVQKKEIIETIIPICCKLKKKLLLSNKKLLPYLYRFIRELLKDYKSEINEIFKEDKQFGIEILHELDAANNIDENEEELVADQQCFVGSETSKESANLIAENDRDQNINQICLNEKDNGIIIETSVKEAMKIHSTKVAISNQDGNLITNTAENFSSHPSGSLLNNFNSDAFINQSENLLEKVDKNKKKSLSVVSTTSKQSIKLSLRSSIKDNPSKNVKLDFVNELSFSQKKDIKKSQQEENQMKKAVDKIKIPPPIKRNLKSKKSLYNSKILSVPSPRTPVLGDKKELLTSTPLITVGNPNFDMDMSSVVDESN